MIIYNKKKLQDGGTTSPSTWYTDTKTTGYIGNAANTINQTSQAKKKTYNTGVNQGNMNTSNVEEVDPSMKTQGEAVAATTGAVSGAMEGAESGDVYGMAAGAVIGGLSSWFGARNKNNAAYDEATGKYNSAIGSAERNYANNAQSRYAREYDAYKKQSGGLLAPKQINNPVSISYKNGGSFDHKINILMSNVSKKA